MSPRTLQDVLEEISAEVRPVDLSARIARTSRRFRRRRAVIGGAVALVVFGTGGAAWSQIEGNSSGQQVGGPASNAPAAPLPCKVFDNFADGGVTPAQQARATAMGTALCAWVGGGEKYNIEEWVSKGGLSGGFSGLTYDVQAHVTGAAAGPVDDEAWVAVFKGAAGTGPFHDGTQVILQTTLANTLKDTIEAPGSPFDAFAKP